MEQNTDVVEAPVRCSRRSRIAKMAAAPALTVAVGTYLSGTSFAEPPVEDPMDGALTTATDDIRAWITTYGVPAVVAAIVFGLIVRIGFKWLRRAGRSVG